MAIDFSSLAEIIRRAPVKNGMTTKIIAIDGHGGAGKSTLATKLSAYLNNCSIIQTDDFASWDNPQNWYPRMLQQVLTPLQQNQVARFQKYSWKKKALDEWTSIAPQEFVILEGVTSSRQEFRPFLSFSIFVKTDRDLCMVRGLERDGVEARAQWQKWMHEEDIYMARDNP